MRSTIDIDERLFEEAKKLTRLKTKKAVVNLSLKELIRKKRRKIHFCLRVVKYVLFLNTVLLTNQAKWKDRSKRSK